MKEDRRDARGFSLVEVMVSLLILLIGVMGLAVAFQRNIYQTNASKNDSQAMMLAYAILDEMENHSFDTLEADLPFILEEEQFCLDYAGLPVAAADRFYIPEVAIINSNSTTIEFEIRINWGDADASTEELSEAGFGRESAASTFSYTLGGSLSQQYPSNNPIGP